MDEIQRIKKELERLQSNRESYFHNLIYYISRAPARAVEVQTTIDQIDEDIKSLKLKLKDLENNPNKLRLQKLKEIRDSLIFLQDYYRETYNVSLLLSIKSHLQVVTYKISLLEMGNDLPLKRSKEKEEMKEHMITIYYTNDSSIQVKDLPPGRYGRIKQDQNRSDTQPNDTIALRWGNLITLLPSGSIVETTSERATGMTVIVLEEGTKINITVGYS